MSSSLMTGREVGSDSGRFRKGAFFWNPSSFSGDRRSYFSFLGTHYSPTIDISKQVARAVDYSEYAQSINTGSVLFSHLVEKWYAERGITSSLSGMFLCPSYQRIIGMGERAIPLILAQLEREGDDPDHWYAALEAITGEDPVPEEAYGDTVKIAETWLSWAEGKNGWDSVESEPAESEF